MCRWQELHWVWQNVFKWTKLICHVYFPAKMEMQERRWDKRRVLKRCSVADPAKGPVWHSLLLLDLPLLNGIRKDSKFCDATYKLEWLIFSSVVQLSHAIFRDHQHDPLALNCSPASTSVSLPAGTPAETEQLQTVSTEWFTPCIKVSLTVWLLCTFAFT